MTEDEDGENDDRVKTAKVQAKKDETPEEELGEYLLT